MFCKKQFLSILAFVGIAVPSLHAETKLWDGSLSNKKVSLSAEIGLNLSQFTHVDRWNGIKAGLNIGVMAEKPILNSLSAKAGLFYTMKGTVGKNDGGFGGTLTTTFSPSYLEIPILASLPIFHQ